MIRPAKPSDATHIHGLWNFAIRETLISFSTTERTLDEVRTAMETYDGFFVAEMGEEVVGYAAYGPFRSGDGYAQTKEHAVMLAPHARGQGLGRALMVAVEEHARARGVHVLVAGVSAANIGAEPFHKALGFATVGHMPEVGHKFGSWQDLVLMQKIL